MCWSSLGKTRSPPVKIMPSEKRGPTCTKLNTLLRTEWRQIIPLFRTERTKPIPYTLSNPLFSLKHSLCLVRSWCNNWLSVPLALPWVRLTTHRTVTWISSISVSFWKSKVLFEKSNLRKSKVSFEKSNAINFGNQKCHLRNQTRQILEIKRVKFWKSKMHLRNQTRQTLEIKIVIREIKRDKFKINMTQ